MLSHSPRRGIPRFTRSHRNHSQRLGLRTRLAWDALRSVIPSSGCEAPTQTNDGLCCHYTVGINPPMSQRRALYFERAHASSWRDVSPLDLLPSNDPLKGFGLFASAHHIQTFVNLKLSEPKVSQLHRTLQHFSSSRQLVPCLSPSTHQVSPVFATLCLLYKVFDRYDTDAIESVDALLMER